MHTKPQKKVILKVWDFTTVMSHRPPAALHGPAPQHRRPHGTMKPTIDKMNLYTDLEGLIRKVKQMEAAENV